MKKIICVLLLLAFTLPSCEKDDLCAEDTNTTPRLVISFFDYTDPDLAKQVTNLKVVADGHENGIVFNETGTEVTRYLANAKSIMVPLDTSADTIKYVFTLNANSGDPGLVYTDTLEFNYARRTIFISRACGYSVYFNLNDSNDLPNPFVLNDDETATQGNWVQNITVENNNLISENETHLNIYW
jgi:hypothetical protein